MIENKLPLAIAILVGDEDKNGGLWLELREGNAVYKLDRKAGVIRHMAGTGKKGFTGNSGPAKEATLSGPKGLSIGPDGDALQCRMNRPHGVFVDADGSVLVGDSEAHRVRVIQRR